MNFLDFFKKKEKQVINAVDNSSFSRIMPNINYYPHVFGEELAFDRALVKYEGVQDKTLIGLYKNFYLANRGIDLVVQDSLKDGKNFLSPANSSKYEALDDKLIGIIAEAAAYTKVLGKVYLVCTKTSNNLLNNLLNINNFYIDYFVDYQTFENDTTFTFNFNVKKGRSFLSANITVPKSDVLVVWTANKQSALRPVLPLIDEYFKTKSAIMQMVQQSPLDIINFANLETIMTNANAHVSNITRVLDEFTATKRNTGTYALGENDKFTRNEVNMTSHNAVLEALKSDIRKAFGVPEAIWDGTNPAGLNNNAYFSLENYEQILHKTQEFILRPMYNFIYAKVVPAPLPVYEFKSLNNLKKEAQSDLQTKEIAKLQALTALNTSLGEPIAPESIAKSLVENPLFKNYNLEIDMPTFYLGSENV